MIFKAKSMKLLSFHVFFDVILKVVHFFIDSTLLFNIRKSMGEALRK